LLSTAYKTATGARAFGVVAFAVYGTTYLTLYDLSTLLHHLKEPENLSVQLGNYFLTRTNSLRPVTECLPRFQSLQFWRKTKLTKVNLQTTHIAIYMYNVTAQISIYNFLHTVYNNNITIFYIQCTTTTSHRGMSIHKDLNPVTKLTKITCFN